MDFEGHRYLAVGSSLACAQRDRAGSVPRRHLSCRMQGLKKCHQRCCLRWTQVFSIGRHIAAALNYLADQLIFCESQSNTVQGRSAFTSPIIERMAVVTLLGLKDQRSLALQGCASVHIL